MHFQHKNHQCQCSLHVVTFVTTAARRGGSNSSSENTQKYSSSIHNVFCGTRHHHHMPRVCVCLSCCFLATTENSRRRAPQKKNALRLFPPVNVDDLVLINVFKDVRSIHQDANGANRCDDEEHVELQAIDHHGHKLPVFSYLKTKYA